MNLGKGALRRSLFCLLLFILTLDWCAAQTPVASAVQTGTAEARFGLKTQPMDVRPPEVHHAALANGITLDHYAEPQIPLVTILVRLGVGSVDDPAGKVGAAAMTGEVLRTGGTTLMNGDRLDRELEERGAQLSIEVDREETWVRLSVLQEDAAWGMRLLVDLLSHPAFPQGKLDEARGRRLSDLRQRLDVPMDVARALYPQLVYGRGNPWGWTDTARTLDALTTEDLRAMYERYYHAGNMKLGLSGAIDWARAEPLAADSFGKLARHAPPPTLQPEVKPVEASRVVVVPRDVTQNVIYLGHEGIGRFTPEKFAVKVFNSVLSGGFTSRLVKEIRSDRGLAYSVFGRIGEGTVRGIAMDGAMTKVPSSATALGLMLKINKALSEQPPTLGEVKVAKESDVNSFAFFFETSEGIVHQKMMLDGFGYPPDYMATYTQKLKAVTPEEIRAAAAKDLHMDRIVVLVVGKVDPDLRKALEQIGPVSEIGDQELRAKWL